MRTVLELPYIRRHARDCGRATYIGTTAVLSRYRRPLLNEIKRENVGHELAFGHREHKELRKTFERRIAERQAYALQRITGPDADKTRSRYPAFNGTLGCPLRDGTMEVACTHGLPIVDTPPEVAIAPACCTQQTVTDRDRGDRARAPQTQTTSTNTTGAARSGRSATDAAPTSRGSSAR
jgi:hypothetical protein